MIIPRPQDALHRAKLYQLLIAIAEDRVLSRSLIFKGGTCAAMLKYLDRFSVDLDFDQSSDADITRVRESLKSIFTKLQLKIKGQSNNVLQYKLAYPSLSNQRSTIKIDAFNKPYKSDQHEYVLLPDIDRYMHCQTISTMFAHKLIAISDRYNKHGVIAGRDIYDIYFFFINGRPYEPDIIEERTGLTVVNYLNDLVNLIDSKVKTEDITEDLNTLLPYKTFNAIRQALKTLVLISLRDEIEQLTQ